MSSANETVGATCTKCGHIHISIVCTCGCDISNELLAIKAEKPFVFGGFTFTHYTQAALDAITGKKTK